MRDGARRRHFLCAGWGLSFLGVAQGSVRACCSPGMLQSGHAAVRACIHVVAGSGVAPTGLPATHYVIMYTSIVSSVMCHQESAPVLPDQLEAACSGFSVFFNSIEASEKI
eukprot:jgi/Ulvmu1/8673/UM047_0011.1